jgi:uncharacterized glyoxalase superfamily protein PhnB
VLLVSDTSQSLATKGVGVTLNFAMTQTSVDNFAAEAGNKGATIISGPVDQPWNAREVTLLDPDGYRLAFTQPLDKQMSMEEVMENVRQSSV